MYKYFEVEKNLIFFSATIKLLCEREGKNYPQRDQKTHKRVGIVSRMRW